MARSLSRAYTAAGGWTTVDRGAIGRPLTIRLMSHVGRPESGGRGGRDAREVLRFALAAQESARTGASVRL